ncbi:MAG TPA: hypothetical protein ENN77_02635, partial [Candidatus Wirthbacteria bacterium]|nr:hypothetical protein [Candidatus Wirthbacteria bacterium]
MINTLFEAYRQLTKSRPNSQKPNWLNLLMLTGFSVLVMGIISLLAIQYYQQTEPGWASQTVWDFSSSLDYSFDADHLTLTDSQAQLVVPWWDTDYAQRQAFQITNQSGHNWPVRMPISITVDTASLSGLKSSCADLRVVYYDGSTHSNLDYDFQPAASATNCSDSSATRLTFYLPTALNNNVSLSRLYLYYDHATASAPGNAQTAYRLDTDSPTLALPLNGSTTGVAGQTTSSSTGALRYGGIQSASLFDGYNDYALINHHASLNTNDQLTIELWVMPQST